MNRLHTSLLTRCYEGTPAEKLTCGRQLVALGHGRLVVDPELGIGLAALAEWARGLAAQMAAMDLGRLCSRCAAAAGGGCCSAEMAGNTDSLQLAINLLLGVEITIRPDSGADCCFLGSQGCQFLIKPIFCLNYNCSHILHAAEPGQLQDLYHHSGRVLSAQVAVENLLIAHLGELWQREDL